MPKGTKKKKVSPVRFGPHQTVESFTQQIRDMMNAGDIEALENTCRHTIKNFKRIGTKTPAGYLKHVLQDWFSNPAFCVSLGHRPNSMLWKLGDIDRTMVFEDLMDAKVSMAVLHANYRKLSDERKEEVRMRVSEITEDCKPNDKLPHLLVIHETFGYEPFNREGYIEQHSKNFSLRKIRAALKAGMEAVEASK